MEKETILNELDELLIEGNSILSTKWTESMGIYTYVDEENYYSWRTKVLSFLKLFLSIESDYINVFSELSESSFSNANICVQTLQNIKEYIKKNYISIEQKNNIKIDEILDLIFTRFHKIARQLQSRYNHRDTLTIDDEYDVQDLLHALLQLYMEEVLIDDNMVFDIDNLKGFLNDTSSFGFIAKENNKIIGFAYCYTLLRPDGKTMFYLHSIGMLPNYQDKGYGSKLLSFIKEYSKEIGCSEMFLITDKGNPRACHVYEKLGGKNDYKDEIVYVYDYEKGDK